MKIITLSDTHNQHDYIPSKYINNLDGDIDMIIYAGDMTGSGTRAEITMFFDWFAQLPFKHKIVIAGNHDFFFEEAPEYAIDAFLAEYPGVIYLNDSGVEIDGYKIWGSPITPYFCNWAFNRVGDTIKQHWDLIPLDTDILITHGPIHGYLDKVAKRYSKGCMYLEEKVREMPVLKLFVCGHIHEGYGRIEMNPGPILINASLLDENYKMVNLPLIVEISK